MKKSRQFIVNLLVLLLMILNPLSSFSDMSVQAQIHEGQEDYITKEEVGQLTDTVSDPRIEETPDFSLHPIETENPPTEPTEPPEDPVDPVEPIITTPEPDEPPVEPPEPTEPPVETPAPVSITATISWQGGEIPRPIFWLKLQMLSSEGNLVDVSNTDAIQANSASEVTWLDVPEFDPNAQYTVAVVDESGKPYSIPGYKTNIDGLHVILTWIEHKTIDITATVEWLVSLEPKEFVDWKFFRKYEQPTIYLRLLRTVSEDQKPVVLLSTELKALTVHDTEATWTGLPKTNEKGEDYIYSVTQVDENGIDFTPDLFEKIENGLLVQNVATPDFLALKSYIAVFSGDAYYSDPDYISYSVDLSGDSINTHTKLKYMWVQDGMLHIVVASTHPLDGVALNGTYGTLVKEYDPWLTITVDGTLISPDGLTGNVADSHLTIYKFPLSLLNEPPEGNYIFVDGQGGGHDVGGSMVIHIPKRSLTITKTWEEGLTPVPVEFKVYGTTSEPQEYYIMTVTVPVSGSITVEVPIATNLGRRFVSYRIEEVGDMYDVEITPPSVIVDPENPTAPISFTVHNKQKTNDVTAYKVWMPEDLDPALKVPVWFQLWRYTGDDPAAAVEVGDPVQITGPDWTYTWADMPETDPNGYEYTYFVTEVDEDGDDWVPDGFTKEEDGMTVTNTYVIPKTDVTAKKVWVNGPTPRPTVWFKLYRQIDGGPIEEVPGAEIKALPDGTTSVTWTDIDKTDNNGNEYTFFVKEVDAGGNDFTPPNYSKVEDGLTVTNTYVIPKTDVTAMKIWEGGSTPRPTVWFKLYRQISGGAVEAVPGAEIKALPDGTTSVTWTGVEKTDINGNEYIFSVKEVNAAGDDFTPENYVKTEAGLVVTNKFVSPKIDVTATKIWKGGSGPRPTIQIQLYRNGVAFGSPVTLVHPTTTYTWTDLDEFDFNGNAYTYTVDEVAIPSGYSKSVVGLTITNTFIEGPEPPEVPYTGDANNALLYGVLAISSLLGFGAVVAGKRRKKE